MKGLAGWAAGQGKCWTAQCAGHPAGVAFPPDHCSKLIGGSNLTLPELNPMAVSGTVLPCQLAPGTFQSGSQLVMEPSAF